MNLALTVLQIVAPVFALAAIGFAWVRLGFEYRLAFVTRLSMTLAVPALIFTALMGSEVAPAALATMSVATLAAYAATGLAMLAVVTLAGLDRRTFLMPLVFGNTGNIGLPLALFAFGPGGLDHAVVVLAMTSVLTFTVGLWVVAGGGNPLKILREPAVAATILGAVFLWQGWRTPLAVTNTLTLIGQMAIPLMLITLGVAVARLQTRRFGRALVLSLLKAAICGATGWTVARAFGLPPVASAVLILQLAAPVAVTSYLLAEKYGADADAVAGLVVVSTLLSIAVLPLLLAALI